MDSENDYIIYRNGSSYVQNNRRLPQYNNAVSYPYLFRNLLGRQVSVFIQTSVSSPLLPLFNMDKKAVMKNLYPEQEIYAYDTSTGTLIDHINITANKRNIVFGDMTFDPKGFTAINILDTLHGIPSIRVRNFLPFPIDIFLNKEYVTTVGPQDNGQQSQTDYFYGKDNGAYIGNSGRFNDGFRIRDVIGYGLAGTGKIMLEKIIDNMYVAVLNIGVTSMK